MKITNLFMMVILSITICKATVYDDAMAYWQFDENDEVLPLILEDSTVNQRHIYNGDSEGPDAEEAVRESGGVLDYCMKFAFAESALSSVDDWDEFDFQPDDSFSIAMWVNKTDLSTNSYLVSKMEPSGNYRGWSLVWRKGLPELGSTNDMLEVLLRSTNTSGSRLWIRSGVALREIVAVEDDWVHVGFTYDGSCEPEGIKLYVNGIAIPVDGYTVIDTGLQPTDPLDNSIALTVGGRNSAGIFGGRMDQIAIWDRQISQSEIQESIDLTLSAIATPNNLPFNVFERNATSDTIDVMLTSQPTSDVTVTVSLSNEQVDIGQGAGNSIVLSFTSANWNIPQTVTVTAIDDQEPEDTQTCTVSFSLASSDSNFSNAYVPSVKVWVYDDDKAGLEASPNEVTVDEEGTLSPVYSVSLVAPCTDDVYVYPYDTADPNQVTISPEYLVFTSSNYDQPQEFTVMAIDDDLTENLLHTTFIEHFAVSADLSYNGITESAAVSVRIQENECIPPYYPADLNEDCYINLEDVVIFASQWLTCSRPGDPTCVRP